MSDFAALRVGLSALYAQRRGLELTGHNVSNANTEGYSRQRVDLTSIGSAASNSMWGRLLEPGQGVRIGDIVRYRDQFLETRAALEHGAERHLGTLDSVLRRVEDYFAEPSETGVAQRLSEFWAGWDDVANHPQDIASRAQLLERANTIAATFNHAGSTLTGMRSDAISQLDATIEHVNAMAQSVGEMNARIKAVLTAGLNANDLMDQRDVLVARLSESVGSTVRFGAYGQADVFIGGTGLVLGSQVNSIDIDASGPNVSVVMSGNNTLTVSGGDAGGLLEAINTTLPRQLTDLDATARTLRDNVNAVHSRIGGTIAANARDQSAAGPLSFDLLFDGSPFSTVSIAGADWTGAGGAAALQTALQTAVDGAIGASHATVTVTGGAGEPLSVSIVPTSGHALQIKANGTNAGFATLAGDTAIGRDGIGGRNFFEGATATSFARSGLMGSTDALAAGTPSRGALDNSIALRLAELGDEVGAPDAQFRSFITELGVQAQSTRSRLSIQVSAVDQVDNARAAQSGVDIDEEMVNLVQYQHAYDAAARFITSIDEMLDTLIHRVGNVGR